MNEEFCFVKEGYEDVKKTFQELYDLRWEMGSSFTAYVNEEKVVELYGGVTELSSSNSNVKFNPNVLQLVASCTKFVASVGVGMLVDRGLIHWKGKISEYWPEFSQNGKEDITIEQLMLHQAGLVALDENFSEYIISDSDRLSEFLARQKTNWNVEPLNFYDDVPATQGYHPITQGFYISEICRRVDEKKRTIGQFIKEELCEPLGIEFYIGLPESEESRVGKVYSSDINIIMPILKGEPLIDEYEKDPRYNLSEEEKAFLVDLFTNPLSLQKRGLGCIKFEGVPDAELGSHRNIRKYEFPASNGMTNSNSMAVIASLCANNGEFKGTKIFSNPTILHEMMETRINYKNDEFMKYPVKFTRGFAALTAQDDKNTLCYGWGGAGGSMMRFHPELQFGCAYVPNKSGFKMAMNDPRPNKLLSSLIKCIQNLKKN